MSFNYNELPKSTILMMKDHPVLKFNFTLGIYDVLNEKLLPWSLKGRLRDIPSYESVKSHYEDIQRQAAMNNNNHAVVSWLSNRVLPLSRKNAKWIYNTIGVEQLQTDQNKAKVSIMCRSVSLQDNYWIKQEGESLCWNDVNIRTNHLNEVLTQIALHGSSLTLCGSLISPELTTQGAYAKAWKREDGELWLYKAGANGTTESKIEVMVSKLLDKCNVTHLSYESAYSNDLYCCRCKCMTTEEISMLSGMDFISYCNVNGLNPDKEMMKIDADSMYKMFIVDYLISNRDRHGLNWGFFFNCDTMEILGCHPLYDHNNAFDLEYMKDKDSLYQFGRKSLKEVALHAMTQVDFHFTDEITRDDFLTDRQYKSFMSRAKDLGIKIVPKQTESSTEEMLTPLSLKM